MFIYFWFNFQKICKNWKWVIIASKHLISSYINSGWNSDATGTFRASSNRTNCCRKLVLFSHGVHFGEEEIGEIFSKNLKRSIFHRDIYQNSSNFSYTLWGFLHFLSTRVKFCRKVSHLSCLMEVIPIIFLLSGIPPLIALDFRNFI